MTEWHTSMWAYGSCGLIACIIERRYVKGVSEYRIRRGGWTSGIYPTRAYVARQVWSNFGHTIAGG